MFICEDKLHAVVIICTDATVPDLTSVSLIPFIFYHFFLTSLIVANLVRNIKCYREILKILKFSEASSWSPCSRTAFKSHI